MATADSVLKPDFNSSRKHFAFTDEHAMEIRVLSHYRDQIIIERTRMINRLRWHLVTIDVPHLAQVGDRRLGLDVIVQHRRVKIVT